MLNKFLDNSLIVGEGGAGIKIVEQLKKKNPDLNYSMVVSSDSERQRANHNEDSLNRIINLHFKGSGKNLKLAIDQAELFENELNNMVRGYNFIFHIFGGGGGTGTGTAIEIARKNPDKKHIFLMTRPHKNYSSEVVKNNAQKAVKIINDYNLGKIILFNNEKANDLTLFQDINDKITNEINYLFELPKRTYKEQDIDSGELFSFLFGGYESGLIGKNKLKIKDEDNYNNVLDELVNNESSTIVLPKAKGLDKFMLDFKLPKGKINKYKGLMNEIRKDLLNKYIGADCILGYFESDELKDIEINIMFSNPYIR